jgi:hypothetical protein
MDIIKFKGSKFLNSFWDLVSEDELNRINASCGKKNIIV